MVKSVSTNEIKFIKSLSQKKFRDETGLFVVEGEKMVAEALKSGFKVETVYRQEEVGEKAMSRISQMVTPPPVLAVVRKPDDICTDPSSALSGKGLFLALDDMRDPGNLGTVLRTSDWFGIDAVFASPDTVDVFNPKVVQATMGAIFRVRFHYCSIPDLCRETKRRGGAVYGTFLDGEDIYGKSLSTGEDSPSVIIIGNESSGISDEVGALVTDRLFLPSYPPDDRGSESLNASVAAALTIAEFRRRSTCEPKG